MTAVPSTANTRVILRMTKSGKSAHRARNRRDMSPARNPMTLGADGSLPAARFPLSRSPSDSVWMSDSGSSAAHNQRPRTKSKPSQFLHTTKAQVQQHDTTHGPEGPEMDADEFDRFESRMRYAATRLSMNAAQFLRVSRMYRYDRCTAFDPCITFRKLVDLNDDTRQVEK